MSTINEKEITELAEKILRCPELGYKEFKTKETIVEYLKSKGFTIENECFETAFSVSIGDGKPHIGLIAELDAIPTLGHPFCNPDDNNAAHACGHNSQCAVMCGVMAALKQEKFDGKVTLFFTPAEEYTDIDYKEKLMAEGKIKYVGGKVNMLEKGLFDDVDIVYHLHATSASKYKFSLNSDLCGFVYKRITFNGKAAHAAIAPEAGINALNAYALFNDAINMLRETFKEEDSIRIHGIIAEGGQTVNTIPERVVYECYVRSINSDTLLDVSKKVDDAAKYCAMALGATATVKTMPGYLPLVQSREISEVIYEEMCKLVDKDLIKEGSYSMAAGDIGDISVFKPTVQIGYGGFVGVPHAKNFMVDDPQTTYVLTAEVIFNSVKALLSKPQLIKDIVENFKPRMSWQQYLDYINQ